MSTLFAILSIVCAVCWIHTESPVAMFFGGFTLSAAIFHDRRERDSK